MKIKPIISDSLSTKHTSFEVDFHFDYNITFICGDSGTGKSAVFSFLKELSAVDKRIVCLNYTDYNRNYKNSIRRYKGKIIIIDNADILLDDKIRSYIAFDGNNQYLIIGRNPTGLMLSADETYELSSEHYDGVIRFTLKKYI
ncbi:hypothetical protein SAMN02910317_03036 [Ruminococcaceae bacterium FB2012]|nr:hypothetical protein SAMN02910317_03036 [Ruminococcaceae bacterium FB2012]